MEPRKVKAFKNLIKECIREVLREELPTILNESRSNTRYTNTVESLRPKPNKNPYMVESVQKPQRFQDIKSTLNPIEQALLQTARNMTVEDKAALKNTGIEQQGMGRFDPGIGEIVDYQPSSMRLPNFPM